MTEDYTTTSDNLTKSWAMSYDIVGSGGRYRVHFALTTDKTAPKTVVSTKEFTTFDEAEDWVSGLLKLDINGDYEKLNTIVNGGTQ